MVALRRRHNKWETKLRVPKALCEAYDGKQFLYHTLHATDKRAAEAEALVWVASTKAQWAPLLGTDSTPLAIFRQAYKRTTAVVQAGAVKAYGGPDDDPTLLGIDLRLDALADEHGGDTLSPVVEGEVAALQDATVKLQGGTPRRREQLEPIFAELSETYIAHWSRTGGLKESNTKQQKRATFHLFSLYFGARPIRRVTRKDFMDFMDALRSLNPDWGRKAAAKRMTWGELMLAYGDSPQGPKAATLNRHAATLRTLWDWAADRGHCTDRNPFSGSHTKLKDGVNVAGFRAWEDDELRTLFDPPPKRSDLTELMLVALYTGMRLNEIASLTWGQLRCAEGVDYIQVEGAKTPAGNRQVPIHSALSWLVARRPEGCGDVRIWPTFNPEGPGKKPGADAGRAFTDHKQSRGFVDERKVFHSFRKNVTRQMERARVPENEWAQVLGHEKAFTYGRYNPDGITLAQKAAMIAKIAYDGVALPHPEA